MHPFIRKENGEHVSGADKQLIIYIHLVAMLERLGERVGDRPQHCSQVLNLKLYQRAWGDNVFFGHIIVVPIDNYLNSLI